MKIHRNFFLGIVISIIVAVADLLSKKAIFTFIENHSNGDHEIKIFDFFSLVMVWNRGVSFGMFNWLENSHIILSLVQLTILIALFFWLFSNQKTHIAIALGLVMGGAFGNLIDRIYNGAVADFLDFYIASYHWPAFNLADSCVFIGVVILLFDEKIFSKKL